MPRRPLLLETFEDRILCDAVPLIPMEPHLQPHADAAMHATMERHEVVFVDTGVADFQKLGDDVIGQGSGDRQFEVVMLDAGRDGIAQVSAALAGWHDVDAVHFVTHATERAVKLDGTWIDAAPFARNRGAIAAWGDALSADADVLFMDAIWRAGRRGRGIRSRGTAARAWRCTAARRASRSRGMRSTRTRASAST